MQIKYLFITFLSIFITLAAKAQLMPISTIDTTNVADTAANENISIDTSLVNILNQPNGKKYILAGVLATGSKSYDRNLIAQISGLTVGSSVITPGGDEFAKGIKKLWAQNAFSDIKVYLVRRVDNNLFIEINVTERPRLSKFIFKGISQSQTDDLQEKTGLIIGRSVNQNMRLNAVVAIKNYFAEKGFRKISIDIEEKNDPTQSNAVQLIFNINKGEKVKIDRIAFYGNTEIEGNTLKRKMKETKERNRLTLFPPANYSPWGVAKEYSFKDYVADYGYFSYTKTRDLLSDYIKISFSSSKFNEKKYAEDKQSVLDYYNSLGYRDAQIIDDTVYYNPLGNLQLDLKISEGRKYYFGNFTFRGNTKYSDDELLKVLGIYKGDVFNATLLKNKIDDPQDLSISTLYQDNGHLRFNATPVEKRIYNDTIDFEIVLMEGPVYTIRNVTISGNDKTNEHVIRREIRTLPGETWNRTNVIRSIRQLSALQFIDAQKLNPTPNISGETTVDVNYRLEEKSADQLELSAGYGGYIGFTGTLGMTFNNFSIKNIFNKKGWDPLPTGDGQQFSVRFQSNGRPYQSYNISFVEPWLGGKKPNALSLSFGHTHYAAGMYGNYVPGVGYQRSSYRKEADTSHFWTTTVAIGHSRLLKWPDDLFNFSVQLGVTQYTLQKYDGLIPGMRDGKSNNLNVKFTLRRSSIDNPYYTKSGSDIYLSAQYTPPYSLWDKSLVNLPISDPKRYEWIEYQKYRFGADWYVPLSKPLGEDGKQLVLRTSVKMGYITSYNSAMEVSPFERFQLGDAGMSNTYQFLGYDIISHRGYPIYDNSNPRINLDNGYASNYFTIFNKYTAELRYPLTLAQSSTIYGMVFFEAANGWYSFKDYNPLQLRRSVGVGMRFLLPMFGLLGFDYGIGLDNIVPGQGLKGAGRFTFMLGMQPD